MPVRAIRKVPVIPTQRAVVAWRNGTETLVIESCLDSESQELGWIIPLPAVPDTIEKESPGLLKTLSLCVQPRITHDLVPGLPMVVVCALIANILVGVALFSRHRVVETLGILVILLVLSGLLLPAVATARAVAKTTSTLRTEKTARVGSYEITVLRSGNAGDLDSWLDGNGFAPLPPEAARIVAGYVRDGWVFAAVRFVREERGRNSPHPIKMTFRTKEAVYPLKLTSIAGGNTSFEIFAIADERVSCDLLGEEFCDRFAMDDDTRLYSHSEYETQLAYEGAYTGIRLGHPGICGLMWNNCVLTKFSGAVSSGAMTHDLRFAATKFRARQRHLYTSAGAAELAFMLAAGLLGTGVLVCMVVFARRIRQQRAVDWGVAKAVLSLAAASACCGGVLFFALPKLAASEITLSPGFWQFRQHEFVAWSIKKEFHEHPEIADLTAEQLAEHLCTGTFPRRRGSGSADLKTGNLVGGGDIQIEDSPGNFTVTKTETNVVIRVYDFSGRPLIQRFPVPQQGHRPD